jgi:His/Glu/Gln/Arg/opine family amino acid ABC transporter permease subunit
MTSELQLVLSSLPALLKGAEITLAASALGIVLGVVVGVALAVAREAGGQALRLLVRVYVSFARGTPLFIQILVLFFVLPAIGVDIPKFYAGVIALSLNSGAYVSEMIRGGLTAVPPGQIEAARALAMPRPLIWRHIVLPQVFALILPPLTVEFIALVKASALLSVIGVVELTRTAQQIVAVTFKPVGIWIAVGVLYFVMCFALAALTRRVERATLVYRMR